MSKYFKGARDRNEMSEIIEDLRSLDTKKQREAVKQIIAFMTIGKDVTSVFTDVLKCIQTTDLELKKLVYLYLINYSRTNPEATILAVNTFDNDTRDKENPLIRALAIRTMACIRVEQITEYISEPLRRTLHDRDPYVRKTAALAVAKLFDIDPELCVDQGFLDDLHELLTDANQMVVSNAVAAFMDIVARSGKPELFVINREIVNSLLNALNEANEWGQSFILDSLVNYAPADTEEAEVCAERVAPRLQHANPGVALSAVRAIVHFLQFFEGNPDPCPLAQAPQKVQVYLRKVIPPMVTLLSSESEVQYIALRTMPLVLQRYPNLFDRQVKVFFPRYSDAIFVKMEKLDILVNIVTDENADQVLLELKENAREIDATFARKAVRSIGHIAVKLQSAADRCVSVLIDLIKSKVDHVVQEAIICLRDIFRKYPDTYESVITTLCENLDTLDEPEAKAALIWIIGEYADRIDNATEILSWFSESFVDEPAEVQLGLLTAAVRLFLAVSNEETQELVQGLLKSATDLIDSPDIRDRAYLYWRMLSAGFDLAKSVACAPKPPISSESIGIDPALEHELLPQIGTLASVLRESPKVLMAHLRASLQKRGLGEYDEDDDEDEQMDAEPETVQQQQQQGVQPVTGAQAAPVSLIGAPAAAPADDLLSLMGMATPSPQPTQAQSNPVADLLGLGASIDTTGLAASSVGGTVADTNFANCPVKPERLQVAVAWGMRSGRPSMLFRVRNNTTDPISTLQVRFDNNAYGVEPAQPSLSFITPLQPGSSAEVVLNVRQNTQANPLPQGLGQIGLKVGLRDPERSVVYYVLAPLQLHVFFSRTIPLASNPAGFGAAWSSADGERAQVMPSPPVPTALPINPQSVLTRMTRGGFVSLGQQTSGDITSLAFAAGVTVPGLQQQATALVQVQLKPAQPYPMLRFLVRSSQPCAPMSALVEQSVKFLLVARL